MLALHVSENHVRTRVHLSDAVYELICHQEVDGVSTLAKLQTTAVFAAEIEPQKWVPYYRDMAVFAAGIVL